MSSAPSITLESRLREAPQCLSRQVGDEWVVLNLDSEQYYGLDEVGSRMVQLVIRESSVKAARDLLMAEFDVGAEELESDLLELCEILVGKGLLVVE